MNKPTKTFGLNEPMDVYVKLTFDLARLKEAESTKDLQFAALDCAIWAYHMIDWVLAAVTDARHIELCGFARYEGRAVRGFIAKREAPLRSALEVCEQIALTSKHRVLTRTPDDPSFATGHTVRFDPPFNAADPLSRSISMKAVGYVREVTSGRSFDVIDVMDAAIANWKHFLQSEGLYIYGYVEDVD